MFRLNSIQARCSAFARSLSLAILAVATLEANAFSSSQSSVSFASLQSSALKAQYISRSQRQPHLASIEFVSQNSVFRDSYAVSRVSDSNSVAVVSKTPIQPRDPAAVREYCRGVLKLDGNELENVATLLIRSDEAIAQWLKTLDEMHLTTEKRLQLAGAADDLRLKQIVFEANLYELAQRRAGKSIITMTPQDTDAVLVQIDVPSFQQINLFDHELRQVTNQGPSQIDKTFLEMGPSAIAR